MAKRAAKKKSSRARTKSAGADNELHIIVAEPGEDKEPHSPPDKPKSAQKRKPLRSLKDLTGDDEPEDPDESRDAADGDDGEDEDEEWPETNLWDDDGEEYPEQPAASAFPDRPSFSRSRVIPKKGHLVTNFPPTGSVKNVLEWNKFRTYWRGVYKDPATRPRMKIYVYRTYPAMMEGYRQVASLEADEADVMSLDDIKHRFGSGSYHFKLNDMGIGSKTICQCNLTEHPELSDYDNFPPMLDPEYLDEDNPVNASYLKRLRIQRHRYGNSEDDEDMRRTDVERDQAISTLTDALVTATRRTDSDSGSSKRDPEEHYRIISHAAEKAIDMVAQQAGRKGQELSTADIISLAKELRGPAADPMATVAPMLELMRESAKSEKEAMRQQMDFYRAMLEKTIEQQHARQQIEAPDNPRKKDDDEDVLTRKLNELKELQNAIALIGGKGRSNPGVDWASLAPAITQVLSPVLSTLQYLAYGFAVKAAGGSHTAPPPPQQPPPQNGQNQQQQGAVAALSEPAASSIPAEHHAATAAFLESIRIPLIQYVRDPERDGVDFAYWFIDWKGESEYARLAGSGPENLVPLLQSYAPIWGEIGHRGEEVLQFVRDFCTALQQDREQDQGSDPEPGETEAESASGEPYSEPDPVEATEDRGPEPDASSAPRRDRTATSGHGSPESPDAKPKKVNLRRKKSGEG